MRMRWSQAVGCCPTAVEAALPDRFKRARAVACRRSTLIYVLLVGILSLACSLALTPLLVRISHGFSVYDCPGHRTVHAEPVPMLGGVGIVVSFLVAVAAAYVMLTSAAPEAGEAAPAAQSLRYYGFVVGGLILMHVVGVIDDVADMPAFGKLFLQVLPALVITAGGATIGALRLPVSGVTVELGAAAVPVTVLWIIGVSTAINLIDGIDGFAGGVALIGALAFGVLALAEGNAINAALAFAFAGAVGGFLVFNLPPARIFMGDGGSLFAGALLAALAVTRGGPADASMSVVLAPVLLAIPILDMAAAVIRRLRRRVPLHEPDREHIHHLLLHRFGTARRALYVGYPLELIIAASVLGYALLGGPARFAPLLGVVVAVVAVYVYLHRTAGRQIPRYEDAAFELKTLTAGHRGGPLNGHAMADGEHAPAKTSDAGGH